MDLVRLREALALAFSDEELRTLCFDLGLEYDDLPGETRAGKARELVAHFARREELGGLLEVVAKRRPNMLWLNAARDRAYPPLANQHATNRMLMLTVGRLEMRVDRVEEQVGRLRSLAAAQLTATLFILATLAGLMLFLLTR